MGPPGLDLRNGRLIVAGRDAEAIAREHSTPVFAYDLVRAREQAGALLDALGAPASEASSGTR